MRRTQNSKSVVAVGVALAWMAFGVFACSDDEPVGGYCEDGQCECFGTDCICPAAGDCALDCTANCDLKCAGSGACGFTCGENCLVQCTGSGNCVSHVGPGSHIRCPSNGNCEAYCSGPCDMTCTGSGDCTLHCPDGQALTKCEGDVTACGACPST